MSILPLSALINGSQTSVLQLLPSTQAVLQPQFPIHAEPSQILRPSSAQSSISSASAGAPTSIMPGQAGDTGSLIQQLNELNFEAFGGDFVARRQTLTAAQALTRRLQTPMDYMWGMTYETPALYASMKTALDLNMFNALGDVDQGPKSVQQLAGQADPNLVIRILRHLASMGVLTNPGPGLYGPTQHSSALQKPPIYAMINYDKEVSGPAFMSFPFFLAKTDFKDPDSEWLGQHPQEQETFNNVMNGYTSQRDSWLEAFPGEQIIENSTEDSMLIVDVGGGYGHDLDKFLQRFPQSSGRLVVQDQAHVIQSARNAASPGLKLMPHDFFTPEPIQGAKAYFMHSILHDWPDEQGREILANIKRAMKKGYSKLLINELVIPPTNATQWMTSMDLMMAAALGAKERGEAEWEGFLQSAGFRVVKFWHSLAVYEEVIEAEPI